MNFISVATKICHNAPVDLGVTVNYFEYVVLTELTRAGISGVFSKHRDKSFGSIKEQFLAA